MLVRKVCLKYFIKSEVHFVGYLYIMEMINACKIEYIKIYFRYIYNFICKDVRSHTSMQF